MDWGKKWLVDFNAVKTQLVSSDRSNNTGSIDLNMDVYFLEKKLSFETLGLTFCSKLVGALTLSLLLKMPLRKLVP